MGPIEPCPSGEHEWAPELKYATSYGLVLFCVKCDYAAQCEIGPAIQIEVKPWWKPRALERKRLEWERRWGFCPKWRADGYEGETARPFEEATIEGKLVRTYYGHPKEPGHHRWPDRIDLGNIACQRCGKEAVVTRIYAHPFGQERVRRFARVMP